MTFTGLTMYAGLERTLQPFGELLNVLRGEVTAVAWPSLLKWMPQVLPRNLGKVDGVSSKVIEVPGNEGVATILDSLMLFVDSVPVHGAAILGKRNLLVNPHRIDQLAVASTFHKISPARSRDPVTLLGHLNDVSFLGTVLAFRQSAETTKRVRSISEIMVDHAGKQLGHSRNSYLLTSAELERVQLILESRAVEN
jgi:hypothetical protein